MLMQQIRRLAVIGILIGIVLGYIVGNLIGPGVMAQTGMETSEIIQGIVAETKPDIVIAIDALAARSTRR